MNLIRSQWLAFLGGFLMGVWVSGAAVAVEVEEALDVAPVWAGHPVGFALLTSGDRQFVAFYDADRRMTVASRTLGASEWQFVALPEQVVWDSHNYVTICVDDGGYLHLSGNMHCVPLVYFRSSKPWDASTFERVPAMTGANEDKVTYPRFLRGARNELLFTYRDGSSGNGNQIYNIYDGAGRKWSRLLDQPLTSGGGKMNAYFDGPRRGPDGCFHLCWVWRDTPDCATNHDLSYARSKDLVHWETSSGAPLTLPITLETGEIVDPVPPGGGIINGNAKLGFDSQGRPVIGYHKFDEEGNTQVYNARLEAGEWRIYQVTDWDYRWEFGGGGAIEFEIGVGGVETHGAGQLSQSYRHVKYGSGAWLLDESTMKRVGEPARPERYPRELTAVESPVPGMGVKWAEDQGSSGENGVRYVLRWETFPSHRDRPREGPLPEPSTLRVYKLRAAG